MVPGPDGSGDLGGVGEAHAMQGLEGLWIVLHAREHQAAKSRRQILIIGEQFAITGVHRAQQPPNGGVEPAQVALAEQGCDASAFAVAFGQFVGLMIADHLDAMFQRAQGSIGLGQFGGHLEVHVARGGQGVQRVDRAGAAQTRVATAQDQLLGLDVEFDLADPAMAQFQVRALGLHALIDLVHMDLALDRVDVGYGGEVQVAAPDEGLQLSQESLARSDIAGRHPGFDMGRPLPVLADALIIVHGGGDRRRHRGRRWIGPQPQIDTEHVTVRSARLQEFGDGLGQAHGQGLRLDPLAQGQDLGVEED